MRRFVLAFASTLAVFAPHAALAQAGPCVELCRIPCVKPISMADRWDDVTGIPGYMGEPGVRSQDWRNNARYDQEEFVDADGDGLYDVGEFVHDTNGNGVFDQEAYDPLTTGYRGEADVGLQLILHPSSSSTAPSPGLFYSVALPPVNKGTPDHTQGAYSGAWAACTSTLIEPGDTLQPTASGMIGPTHQQMHNLIAADPDAYWDGATQQVVNSAHAFSPRIIFVSGHDPRVPLVSGHGNVVVVRKVFAFFAEQVVGTAQLRCRLLRVQAAGETCGGGSAGGFIVQCPVPATGASWGRLKANYR